MLISSPDAWDWRSMHALVVMHRRTLCENVDRDKIKAPLFTTDIDILRDASSCIISIYRWIVTPLVFCFSRLFEMGFAEQLQEIIRRLPDSRQTLLFSATLPKMIVEFARAGNRSLDVNTCRVSRYKTSRACLRAPLIVWSSCFLWQASRSRCSFVWMWTQNWANCWR